MLYDSFLGPLFGFNRTILECKDVLYDSFLGPLFADLIEPYWNVKTNFIQLAKSPLGFNRTILECKEALLKHIQQEHNRFNRTILECKER